MTDQKPESAGQNGSSQNELEQIKKDLEISQQKAEEYLDGWKRAKADYINFKKENEKRQVELIQFSNAGLVAELLPIYDHFKLALAHVPAEQQSAEWVKGFFHIKNQWHDFFKRLGIEEIKTVGERFNPELHEAVSHEEKSGIEADIIFEETKAGYTLHGKIIYPAKVKVAK